LSFADRHFHFQFKAKQSQIFCQLNDYLYEYSCNTNWWTFNFPIKLMRLLLENPHYFHSLCENGKALRWAADCGHYEIPGVDPSSMESDALTCAVMKGHTAVVELLLQYPRVDPTAAIRWPCWHGNLEILKLLLSSNPSVVQGNCAIKYAAQGGQLHVLQYLLSDPRLDPSANENEALLGAIRKKANPTIMMLLADPRLDLSVGYNAILSEALEYENFQVVVALLSDPRLDPSISGNHAILLSTQFGHVDLVKKLLEDSRVDPGCWENLPLRVAAKTGHFKIVELLLADIRVDPAEGFHPHNQAGNDPRIESAPGDPLSLAIKNGHLGVVDLLLADSRVDPARKNHREEYPIQMAAERGLVKIVLRLLDDPHVNPLDWDPIYSAASKGKLDLYHEITRLLMTDPRVDPYCSQVLRLAYRYQDSQMMGRLVLDSRFDFFADIGFSLAIACEFGYPNIVETIISKARGGRFVTRTSIDSMLLSCGVLGGCKSDVVRLLIGDETLVISTNENYLLRFMASHGEYELVHDLLQRGADPSALDNEALRLAVENGHVEVVTLLMEDARVSPFFAENFAFKWAKRNGHLAVVDAFISDPRCVFLEK
ncbi:ankyrin repeat-containing domain protein, partial [Obelidium mucronatum]